MPGMLGDDLLCSMSIRGNIKVLRGIIMHIDVCEYGYV